MIKPGSAVLYRLGDKPEFGSERRRRNVAVVTRVFDNGHVAIMTVNGSFSGLSPAMVQETETAPLPEVAERAARLS